jgi:hypothetical protein
MSDLHSIYSSRISEGELKLVKLNRLLWSLSLVRLISFVLTFVAPFYLYSINAVIAVVVSVGFFALFLFMVKRYLSVSRDRSFLRQKVKINQREEEAIKHNFSMFNAGEEFINPNHINSYDLDLFGRGSLFQYINRTVTIKGKAFLSEMFQNPLLDVEEINNRQLLVKELSVMIDWRQDFSAQGLMYDEKDEEVNLFEQWSNEEFSLKSKKIAGVLLVFLPLLSVISVLVWIFMGNNAIFILSAILQAILWFVERNNIKLIYSQFGKRVDVLHKYGQLLQYVETVEWRSKEGKAIVDKLRMTGLPSSEILKLKRMITAFDNRNNMLIGVVFNLLFVWDVFYTYRLIKWHIFNKDNFKVWGETIAFFDAINSLANYNFNHPEYAFPELTTGSFNIEAKQLGHPLIQPSKRVNNDFEFGRHGTAMIVTGANMAGKSTFLRTVGVNMVLGMCGAPVCAQGMKFKPVEVFSNMRTTDSLFDDESYFFAELKRLKAILDEVEEGKEMFIILDEILKGTNSVDKLSGSIQLVSRLINQNVPAIIATHDLKLTEIEKEFPGKLQNRCFEIDIVNDEMHFDYKLRKGVTTIMNATFLMKKMGIIC